MPSTSISVWMPRRFTPASFSIEHTVLGMPPMPICRHEPSSTSAAMKRAPAGTFSDGKLWSQISDPRHLTRKVLTEFVKAGAPEEILYVAKPHIGTFRLVSMIEKMRAQIESLGGEIRFQHQVCGLALAHEGGEQRIASLQVRRLASGEIRNVRYEDYDSDARGIPAEQEDYEFSVGILRNGAREVELDRGTSRFSLRGQQRFGLLVRGEQRLLLQHLDFGVPLQDLEAGVDEVDAVVDGLQLGRLVDHMHRRRHLAAIVQQAGDLELVAVLVAHVEGRERPCARVVYGLGEHHRQLRHALAMPARVRRLLVDRGVHQVDERLEQLLQLDDEHPVGERDRRLRGERLGEPRGSRGGAHEFRAGGYGVLPHRAKPARTRADDRFRIHPGAPARRA